MANRFDEVLAYLHARVNEPISLEKLLTDCSISKRTFYNYVKTMREDSNCEIEIKNGQVRLIQADWVGFEEEIPQGYEARRSYYLRKGLILQQELEVDELLDYLAISQATLHSDIIRIRKEIRPYHVRFAERKGRLVFLGNYHDLKNLTRQMICQENGDGQSMLSSGSLAELFPNLDVPGIREIILNEFSAENTFMDEYSTINLLVHILISTNQEMNGIVPKSCNAETFQVSETIGRICHQIEQRYGFSFSQSSKVRFSLIAEPRAVNAQLEEVTIKHPEILSMVDQIFNQLLDLYSIDLSDPAFIRSFTLHLDAMMTRLESGVVVDNPLFGLIRQSSPITFDLAVYTASLISARTGFILSESEVGYLALHLGTRIEEMRSIRSRLLAAIVCPEYYVYPSGIRQIPELYQNDLYIKNICTSFDDLDPDENLDLIICTVYPAKLERRERVLKVSLFLNLNDRQKITDAILEIRRDRQLIQTRQVVMNLFSRDLFFKDCVFESREEAIHFLCEKMAARGFVEEEFESTVLERERISPTDFGRLAIPHPADYSSLQTAASVCILKEPLFWSRNRISIIILLGISRNDFMQFEDLFSSIVSIAQSSENINALAGTSNYEEFIDRFLKLMSTQS